MFDVNNVKVGDYVETRDNKTGSITRIGLSGFDWLDHSNWLNHFDWFDNANEIFKQIGAIRFYKEEQVNNKKIAPLTFTTHFFEDFLTGKTFVNYEDLPESIEVIQKINEIIDYLSKE